MDTTSEPSKGADETNLAALEARIVALELLIRGMFTGIAARHPSPSRRVAELRDDSMRSLEYLDREMGPRDGALKEAVGKQLRLTFDAIVRRVEALQRGGLIHPDREL